MCIETPIVSYERDGHQSYSMGVLYPLKRITIPNIRSLDSAQKMIYLWLPWVESNEVTLRKNPDPSYGNTKPSDTPRASKQMVLTPHDIPRIFRVEQFPGFRDFDDSSKASAPKISLAIRFF